MEHAASLDPIGLGKAAQRLRETLDPDGAVPTDREHERRRDLRLRHNADGSGDIEGRLTPAATAAWQSVLDALASPRPADDGTADPRTPGQRRHDALLDAGLRLIRSGALPDSGGAAVTILVTTTVEQLEPRAGYATTAHGGLLSITELLAMATEAHLVPVVLDHAGGILTYGRTRRFASSGQRLALAARDGGCSFPGCDTPPALCEAHHVQSWLDGGTTDLSNLTLVCGYHHREFERRGWSCAFVDAVPHWIPPPWRDPHQRPLRNAAHHTDPAFVVPESLRPLVGTVAGVC